MGRPSDDEDESLKPTQEQIDAYCQRAQATVALARLDKLCAHMPGSQMNSHPTQVGCILLASLSQAMVLVEYNDTVGVGVPPIYADWIEDLPFDFVAITEKELFFVTKTFTWLGSEIPEIGISLGHMMPSKALAKLCGQDSVDFFKVNLPISSTPEGQPLRSGRSVPVYQVPDTAVGVGVLKVRSYYERLAAESRTDPHALLSNHFLE